MPFVVNVVLNLSNDACARVNKQSTRTRQVKMALTQNIKMKGANKLIIILISSRNHYDTSIRAYLKRKQNFDPMCLYPVFLAPVFTLS